MRAEELDTPALCVDRDVLERNLARMASYCREHRLNLRPHTKTHKSPEIARMQVAHGFPGLTVAKLGEAEVMADGGLRDLLIAYPILGAPKLERLVALSKRLDRLLVAVDSIEVARGISEAAAGAGVTIGLLAEVDTGMGRCGVQGEDAALTLARAIHGMRGAKLAGILTYPGFISEPPERVDGAMREWNAKVQSVVERIRKDGLPVECVSAGSTPTALHSHTANAVTEIRPGTYVYNDRNCLGLKSCDLGDCALTVLVTVVSTSVKGRAIIDGGSKTFSSDTCLKGGFPGFGQILDYPEVLFEKMNEEHGYLDVSRSSRVPRVGEKVRLIPNHICVCVNMHDQVYLCRKGEVERAIPVAGRGKVR